jgi:hypothetical protein
MVSNLYFLPLTQRCIQDGNTALHWAVVGDVPSMLRQVMAKGIPYNARNNVRKVCSPGSNLPLTLPSDPSPLPTVLAR